MTRLPEWMLTCPGKCGLHQPSCCENCPTCPTLLDRRRRAAAAEALTAAADAFARSPAGKGFTQASHRLAAEVRYLRETAAKAADA